MISFKPNKMQSSWGKGFLTSLLGTTISILLTFGTSALVESKEKADVQRQTAMMVIHDIDVCVDQMEMLAKKEEERNNAVQYSYGGKWSLKDDTLFIVNSPKNIEVKLDTTRITYRPEMRDSVKRIIRNMNIKAWKESLQKSLERDRRDTFPVTTNKAHDKIEMVVSRDKDGNVESQYLKRMKE